MKEHIVQNDIENPTNSHGYMFGRTISQLIRCKDCKHWNANSDTHRCFVWCVYTCGDGYCHRAERKEE